jgi:hypothetical protein
MYYMVEEVTYKELPDGTKVAMVRFRRKWGERNAIAYTFWGTWALLMSGLLNIGKLVDITRNGIMRFPKPRRKKK